ncbi:MAG: hypothetical protein V3W14_12750 [Candidatus Neomarinimicrobiota bacterium]
MRAGLAILVLAIPLFARQVAVQDTEKDSTQTSKDPGTALLTAIIPGGGQAYNGAWIKMIGIVAAEIYFYNQFRVNRDRAKNYEPDVHPLPQYRYVEKRNKFAWWVVGTYFYGMVDAFVDAHLNNFPPDSSSQNINAENPATEEQQ